MIGIIKILRVFGLSAVLSLLVSCISDGTNHTGGEYLAQNGIVLKNPLYHVVIPEFPVDSVWSQTPVANNFGKDLFMLGVSGNFSSQARLAFSIIDSTTLSKLTVDTGAEVRLSLRTYQSLSGLQTLKSSVGDSSTTGNSFKPQSVIDTLTFLVESWLSKNVDAENKTIAETDFTKSSSIKNHRFLNRMDTAAVLDSVSTMDTIRLAVKNAYTSDSLQTVALPNLKSILKTTAKSTKWLIQLQLTPLPSQADTGAGMLRIECRVGTNFNSPALLFSKDSTITTTAAAQIIRPISYADARGFYRYYANYTLRHSETQSSIDNLNIIPALDRALHIKLSRERLRDSISAVLKKNLGITTSTQGNITGDFDLSYFVPYGQITLPLAENSAFEGGHPLEMQISSGLDSLLPETSAPIGQYPITLVPLNKTVHMVVTTDPSNDNAVIDTISLYYSTPTLQNASLKMVILKSTKDSTKNDTSFIRVGQSRTLASTLLSSQNKPTVFTILAGPDNLSVTSYLTSGYSTLEENNLRDPATGTLLTTLADRLSRLLKPAQSSFTLRVTRGLQVLLNRADLDRKVFSGFVIKARAPIDTSVATSNTVGGYEPQDIAFPVLSVVVPKLKSGKLTVGLDLYLYPLKQER